MGESGMGSFVPFGLRIADVKGAVRKETATGVRRPHQVNKTWDLVPVCYVDALFRFGRCENIRDCVTERCPIDQSKYANESPYHACCAISTSHFKIQYSSPDFCWISGNLMTQNGWYMIFLYRWIARASLLFSIARFPDSDSSVVISTDRYAECPLETLDSIDYWHRLGY